MTEQEYHATIELITVIRQEAQRTRNFVMWCMMAALAGPAIFEAARLWLLE